MKWRPPRKPGVAEVLGTDKDRKNLPRSLVTFCLVTSAVLLVFFFGFAIWALVSGAGIRLVLTSAVLCFAMGGLVFGMRAELRRHEKDQA